MTDERCKQLMERIAQKQARIDQLIQEVAACADVEAAQRGHIAELTADRDRLDKYWKEALATHENIEALKSRIAVLEARVRLTAERWQVECDNKDERIAELEAKLAQQAEAQEPVLFVSPEQLAAKNGAVLK